MQGTWNLLSTLKWKKLETQGKKAKYGAKMKQTKPKLGNQREVCTILKNEVLCIGGWNLSGAK